MELQIEVQIERGEKEGTNEDNPLDCEENPQENPLNFNGLQHETFIKLGHLRQQKQQEVAQNEMLKPWK